MLWLLQKCANKLPVRRYLLAFKGRCCGLMEHAVAEGSMLICSEGVVASASLLIDVMFCGGL